MTASTHGIFMLKHKQTFDCPSISRGCWIEALCRADLTRLVSARFILPPSTEAQSVLGSAQNPWCSHQSIKSISVSCSLGDTGWQPKWAHSSSPSSSSCHSLLSLCNMSDPQRLVGVRWPCGFVSSGTLQDVFSLKCAMPQDLFMKNTR